MELPTQDAAAAAEPTYVGSDLLDYHKAKPRIDALIGSWSDKKCNAEARRKERYIDLNAKEMRATGELAQNEAFIPQRIIDNNIVREKGDAMAFLNSSHRLAHFRCVDDPLLDTRQLETDVTKGLTYEGWYKEFDEHYDGAALHGWDFIEVEYDESKPLRVAFTHVGYDKLMFNTRVRDLQTSPVVIREFSDVTTSTLEEFKLDFGFSPEVVDSLLSKYADRLKDDHTFCVYRIYFRMNKCIYVAWYSKEAEAKDWLKAPEKLRCGIRRRKITLPQLPSIGADLASLAAGNNPMSPAPINLPVETFEDEEINTYPIFCYLYKPDENTVLTEHKGRGFMDQPQQEAVTAITSSFVTMMLNSALTFASPKEADDTNSRLEEIELENNTILPVPINFYNMPPPDPATLNALQYFDSVNSRSIGKIATAVSNRKDSRKTSKELGLAEQEQQKLSSTGLANYSEFLRSVFGFAWLIIQSQALEGNITLLLKQTIPETPPNMGMLPMPQPEPIWENDVETIAKTYDIRPAGEIDVIQKEQQIQDFQQDWPVFQNTPIAMMFLEEYIRLRYPLLSDKFIATLRAGDPAKNIILALLTTLKGALQPQEIAALTPQEKMQLMQLVMQAQQYVAGGTTQGAEQ